MEGLGVTCAWQPIARLPSVWADCIDHDFGLLFAIHGRKGEAHDSHAATAFFVRFACIRNSLDSPEHFIDSLAKPAARSRSSCFVVSGLVKQFSSSSGVEAQALHGASRFASAMTSSAS